MVWGRNIHLQEIDVFSTKKHKNPIVGQSQLNQLKILRTVAESDTHRNHEAIAFGPDMSHIPLNGVSLEVFFQSLRDHKCSRKTEHRCLNDRDETSDLSLNYVS